MNMLRIALCDIRRVLKDPMIVVWWLAMPLVFVLMFGSMVGDYTNRGVWLPIVNLDRHELSGIFIDQLRSDKYYIDVRSATEEINAKNWPRAIILPATFSESILDGSPANFVFTEGDGEPDQLIAAHAQLVRAAIKFNGAIAAIDLIEQGWSELTKQRLLDELDRPQALSTEVKQHFSLRPPPIRFAYMLPAYLVMFTMMNSIMFGGITLVYERSQKQLIRMAATPVSVVEIFIGKILGRMMQPAIQGSVLLGLGVLFFGVPLGDHPLVLIPVLLSFAVFCGGLGLLFGVIFSTEQQVSGIGILSTMILSALGGCWWPLEIVPETFKYIAQFTPTYWALQGIHDVISFGKSWADVIPECAVLLSFGLAIIGLSIPLFRWE